jgi:hypothetical protein
MTSRLEKISMNNHENLMLTSRESARLEGMTIAPQKLSTVT